MPGKIITGPAGFEFITRGVLPPNVESLSEAQQVAWVTAQFAINAMAMPWIRNTEVRPLRLGLNGEILGGQPV